VRTRGRLQAFLDNATAALDGYHGAFGIAVATTAAVAVGATAVPTPITEQDWDGWLYWQSIQLLAPGIIDGGTLVDRDLMNIHAAYQSFDIDSKAMRKLAVGDSIYACMEVVEIGTATLQWSLDSRVLVKLA